ncbi:MAG: acyl--CoA ligase, partial [Marinifilaceae bacterium]|nr:acyl--CoA ligase [Marinifilaceae bacterium]
MKTIVELFETSVNKYPDNIYLWEKPNGEFKGTTYRETREKVLQFAAGLLALGIRKSDRIGLVSEGRNQWIISELGILYAGAINVPLSVKLDAKSEMKFRLAHSGCRMVVVSKGQAPKIEEIRNELPELEKVIYLDEKEEPGENDLYFCDVVQTGKTFLRENKSVVESAWKSVGPNDLANISYTSGTTADPKGIMLSHLNYAANVVQANTLMEITPDWKTLAFLPWDHAFA